MRGLDLSFEQIKFADGLRNTIGNNFDDNRDMYEKCPVCSGTGLNVIFSKKLDSDKYEFWDGTYCPACRGVGYTSKFLFFKCDKCNGEGWSSRGECKKCKGNGFLDWISNVIGVLKKNSMEY